jgi:hypothetical protein
MEARQHHQERRARQPGRAHRVVWHDVVKRASELNAEERPSDSSCSKKREHKEGEGGGRITENTEGKDMKKQKTDKKNTKAGEEEKNAAPGPEEQKKEENKDEEVAPKRKH